MVQANYAKPSYGVICKVFGDMHPSLAVERYFEAVGFKATEDQVRHLADIIFAQRQNVIGKFYTKHFLPLLQTNLKTEEIPNE